MALLADIRKGMNDVSRQDDLARKVGSIEAQVVVWIAEAQALYESVDAADRPEIAAMRQDLKASLAAAIA
jgi:hypothetical protein